MKKKQLKKLIIILNKISIILVLATINITNINNTYAHQKKTQQTQNKNNQKKQKNMKETKITTTNDNTTNNEIITITTKQELPLFIINKNTKLKTYTPTNDSSEYCKNISGFSLIRNGGTNGDSVFRGMCGSRLRTLVNNGEIIGACAARMDTSSAYIYPDNFDTVTIIKGPQTVIWGPVASAGLLRFERNTPILEKQKFKINTNITIGSYNKINNNINTTYINKYYYLRHIGNISHSKNYKNSDKIYIPSAWNKWNSDIIIGLTPVKNTKMEINLGNGNGNAIYAAHTMNGTQFKRNSFSINLEQNNINELLNTIEIQYWDHHVNHIMTRHEQNKITKKTNNNKNHNIKNNVDRSIWGCRSITNWTISENQLKTGLDMQINQHKKQDDNKKWNNDTTYQDMGIFAELNWQKSLSNKLISGARVEKTIVKNNISSILKIRKKIYPALFLRYEHDIAPLSVKTYTAIGFNERFPDYWELITLKSGRCSGNDAFYRLKTEKNIQIDIGGYIQKKFTNIWISSYAGYIKDFILFRYNISHMNNNTSYADNINATTLGSELGITHNINKNWTIKSDLAWSLGKNISDNKTLPQIPPLEGKIVSIWKKNKLTITNILRIVNSQKRIAVNDGYIINKDYDCSKRFSVLSSYLEWIASDQLIFMIGVDNILNKYYTEHLNLKENPKFKNNKTTHSLSEPGRNFWLKIKYYL